MAVRNVLKDGQDALNNALNELAGTTRGPGAIWSMVEEIDRDRALQMISDFKYDKQRAVRDGYVKFLQSEMKAGTFNHSHMKVDYLDNVGFLVDGQHRLWAVVQGDHKIKATITYRIVADKNELAHDYSDTDNGMARSAFDALKATGLMRENQLNLNQFNALHAATSIIIQGFSDVSKAMRNELRSRRIRERVMQEYMPYYLQYLGATYHRSNITRTSLNRSSVVAIGLVTFAQQRDKAEEFWVGVARNDGLRAEDPRAALIAYLATNKARETSLPHSVRCVAGAWNAWCANRNLRQIHPTDLEAPILITGTRYDGKTAIRPYRIEGAD